MRGIKSATKRLRKQFFYTVPAAGKKIGLGRSSSYKAARNGVIPAKREGKLLLVPKGPWDRKLKELHREAKTESAIAAESTTT